VTHLDDVLKKDRTAETLPEVETRLLKATHDLSATLGVDPVDALCALASATRCVHAYSLSFRNEW
jgi:hypothetical protein